MSLFTHSESSMTKETGMSENGKTKLIYWLLGIVVILISAIWGITWGSTLKAVDLVDLKAEQACLENKGQDNRLIVLEENQKYIKETVTKIYEEMKKGQ